MHTPLRSRPQAHDKSAALRIRAFALASTRARRRSRRRTNRRASSVSPRASTHHDAAWWAPVSGNVVARPQPAARNAAKRSSRSRFVSRAGEHDRHNAVMQHVDRNAVVNVKQQLQSWSKPRPWIYWSDVLLSAAVGWSAFSTL